MVNDKLKEKIEQEPELIDNERLVMMDYLISREVPEVLVGNELTQPFIDTDGITWIDERYILLDKKIKPDKKYLQESTLSELNEIMLLVMVQRHAYIGEIIEILNK